RAPRPGSAGPGHARPPLRQSRALGARGRAGRGRAGTGAGPAAARSGRHARSGGARHPAGRGSPGRGDGGAGPGRSILLLRRVGHDRVAPSMTLTSAALLLFIVMDPLGNVPFFLSALREVPEARQRAVVRRELLIALGVMVVFLFS